jgi:hypothetical protein
VCVPDWLPGTSSVQDPDVVGMLLQVYVLADTSYNPLSIDEVAAAHVKADCVVRQLHRMLPCPADRPVAGLCLCDVPCFCLYNKSLAASAASCAVQMHETLSTHRLCSPCTGLLLDLKLNSPSDLCLVLRCLLHAVGPLRLCLPTSSISYTSVVCAA